MDQSEGGIQRYHGNQVYAGLWLANGDEVAAGI